MQKELDLISHQVENTLIFQRTSDGYVNATAMCKASGKQFSDYSRLGVTQDFLAELSAVRGIPRTALVLTFQGGAPELQGTWVHPDVAINLGQWCSPRFAVAVSQWVREWMEGKVKRQTLPYHLQRYIANSSQIPPTHFSMLSEMTLSLIAPLEMAGYTIPDGMLPDISTGKLFCKWLREVKGINTNALPIYHHEYEDGRVVPAKLYPNEVLADFRIYFRDVWLREKALGYFQSRDLNALPFLPKLLPSGPLNSLT